MRQACQGLYYGPEPSSKTIGLEEIHEQCDVIINCRPLEGKAHWYFPSKGSEMDETIRVDEDTMAEKRFIAFPIANRALPDKKELLKVCRTVVDCIRKNKDHVYIHCRRDKETCGPLIVLCMYWLKGEKDYDPINDLRQRMEHQLCSTKDQRNLVTSCYEFVQSQWYWSGQGFVPQQKKARKEHNSSI